MAGAVKVLIQLVERTKPLTAKSHIHPDLHDTPCSYLLQYAMTALPQSRFLRPGDALVTECNLTYASGNAMFAVTQVREGGGL